MKGQLSSLNFTDSTSPRLATPTYPMRLPGLDGLRAIAVSLVILVHFYPVGANGSIFERALQKCTFGVEIFFVLSGFLITFLLLREEVSNGSISLRLFYARRALRILPPLEFFLLIVWFLSIVKARSVPGGDILAGLLFARNYFGSSIETAHLWSLAIEEQFYILWPLLLVLLPSRRARIIFCSIIVCLSVPWRQLSYLLAGGAAHVNSGRTDLRVEPLMMGALLALLVFTPNVRTLLASPRASGNRVAAFAFSLLCIAQLTDIFSVPVVRGLIPTISYLCVAAIINCSIHNSQGVVGVILEFAPLVWIGRLSYSLYLWQQLFILGAKDGRESWMREFPANLLLTVGLAIFSYYLVEQPLLSLRRWFRREAEGKIHSDLERVLL